MIRISRYHHSKTKEGEDRRDDEKGGIKWIGYRRM
jgi:hypothetical protein